MSTGRGLFWPTVLAVCLLALTLAAGRWQLMRAESKQALAARLEARMAQPPLLLEQGVAETEFLVGRRVVALGHFDAARQIYVDNRNIQGRSAYQVYAPLVLADGRALLVDRGRVAHEFGSPPPQVPPPAGKVRIAGIVMPPPGKFLELSRHTIAGAVWQNLDLPRVAAMLPYPLMDVVLVQTGNGGDGLYRQWVRPDTGIERHWGYAFQWFAMSAAIVVIYGVLYVRRSRQGKA